jgi:hypothetical protein
LRIKKKKKRERGENIVNFYYIGTMLWKYMITKYKRKLSSIIKALCVPSRTPNFVPSDIGSHGHNFVDRSSCHFFIKESIKREWHFQYFHYYLSYDLSSFLFLRTKMHKKYSTYKVLQDMHASHRII